MIYSGGVIRFLFFICGSWSCSNCRKVNSVRLLDRLCCGMEFWFGFYWIFVMLTIDFKIYGARVIGQMIGDNGNPVNIVTPPTAD